MLDSVVYNDTMTKRIEIVQTVATLIEPSKKYILQVDRDSITMEDARKILDTLSEWQATGVLVMYDGKPLQLIEVQDA